jgi:hypothetical protein
MYDTPKFRVNISENPARPLENKTQILGTFSRKKSWKITDTDFRHIFREKEVIL